MATTPISSYSTTRITGLASGMDTDSLITKMMNTEQMKVDRLYQKTTTLTWKREAYTSVNTLLSGFRAKFMSASSADNIFASSAYRAFKVNMDANKYVDVKATTSASLSQHTITDVKLAESAEVVGAKHRTSADNQIDRSNDSIKAAAEKLGVDLQLEDGKFSFSVNGKDFSFDAETTSLQKMMDTVNGTSGLGVKMAYSQITEAFTFMSAETGASAKVELANKGSVNAFGDAASFFGAAEGTVNGADAQIVIDGETVTRSSNNFVLDGVEFNLKANFTAGSADDEIKYSVSQDVDGVVDKVKKFVEEYNTLVKSLTDMVSTRYAAQARSSSYEKYEPLTEAQKEEMTEKEIEKWETEAKKGLLRNDADINKLLSDMRLGLYEKVGDTGLSPADIGLGTGSWSNGGQISFDETKFRAALQESPDRVAQVMSGVSESSDAKTVYKESGIITKFFDQMTAYESDVKKTTLVETDKAITQNEKDRVAMKEKMYAQQERYYMQFAQMEQLLTQYQSQSSWLTQQLASLG